MVDGRACTSVTTSPSVNVAEDTVNGGWDYVYKIGSLTDLEITWSKAGGNCDITAEVDVDGNSSSDYSWVANTAVSTSSIDHTLNKYDIVDASTTISIPDNDVNASIDGTYTITYTETQISPSQQSTTAVTARVIWDVC